LAGCGERGGGGDSSLYNVVARLQSSTLSFRQLNLWVSERATLESLMGAAFAKPQAAATLVNIDGMADSFLIYTEEDGCAFNLWRSSGSSGPVGLDTSVPQAFDLDDPESWTASKGGLRDGCSGAKVKWAGMIFHFMDFHITAHSTTKVVRLIMGDAKADFTATRESSSRVFYRGDLLIKDEGAADSTFAWADSGGVAHPVSGARPSSPIRVANIANDPVPTGEGEPFWYEWQFALKDSNGAAFAGSLDSSIVKGVLDVNTDAIDVSVSGGVPSNNGQFLNQLSVNIFSDLNLINAVPTFLKKEEIGTSSDPDLSEDKGADQVE
jgi:hypothetical protein